MIIWANELDSSYHNEHLAKFLKLTMQCELKPNYGGVQHRSQVVCFFDMTFIVSDPRSEIYKDNKVKTINNMLQPTNVEEFQCFVGMVNILNKYFPRLAKLSDCLCECLCEFM